MAIDNNFRITETTIICGLNVKIEYYLQTHCVFYHVFSGKIDDGRPMACWRNFEDCYNYCKEIENNG